ARAPAHRTDRPARCPRMARALSALQKRKRQLALHPRTGSAAGIVHCSLWLVALARRLLRRPAVAMAQVDGNRNRSGLRFGWSFLLARPETALSRLPFLDHDCLDRRQSFRRLTYPRQRLPRSLRAEIVP